MADDRRQQIADEAARHRLSVGVNQRQTFCPCGWFSQDDANLKRPVGLYSEHVAALLLPLIDRVAAEAAAEALEQVAEQIKSLADGPVPAIDSAFDSVVIARARAREHRARAAQLRANPTVTDAGAS